MEISVFLLFWFAPLSQAQTRSCFDVDNIPSLDFPCDPSSNVSACCSSGGRCATNLYCVSPRGAQLVGTCTDRTFTDTACPWPLGKANASLNFDHFDYKLNTTTCSDGTICPSKGDPNCCSAGRGKVEINFRNNAVIPSASRDLASYYSAAGYTIAVTTSATTSATTKVPSTTTPTIPVSISQQTTKTASPDNSNTLSTGAKVGISIGLGLILVLGISLFVLFRLRRRKGQGPADANASSQESHRMIPDEQLRAEQSIASELPAPVAEMEAHDNPRKTWNGPR